MLYVLKIENSPKDAIFIKIKKGQEWPNHFISGKLFQKRPNKLNWLFERLNGNPVFKYVLW